jgi:hypothetical protein
LCSELEQNIRISSHPSLVKPGDVDAAAGAGAVINMPDNMDPALKPYLLQPTSATVDSIIKAIEYHVGCIDKMSSLSSVRGTKAMLSGVALEAEFLLLNTRLADKASNLEKIEYKIWDLWFDWQGQETPEDFEVEYEDSFSIRDSQRELDMLKSGLELIDNALFRLEAKKAIVNLTLSDDNDIEAVCADLDMQYEVLLAGGTIADIAAIEAAQQATDIAADMKEPADVDSDDGTLDAVDPSNIDNTKN